MKYRRGKSEKKKGWLGNTYIQHYNSEGKKSGKSEFKTDWMGSSYTQHYDGKGNKTGKSRHKKDWTGSDYTQKYNSRAEKSGTSRNTTGWFGNKYTQHYDQNGNKTDVSERKTSWIGNKYTERISTQVGGRTRVGGNGGVGSNGIRGVLGCLIVATLLIVAVWICIHMSFGEGRLFASRDQQDRASDQYMESRSRAARPTQPNKREALTYFWRAETDCQTREFNKAIADCSRAIELDPTLAKAYTYRGRAFNGKGEFEQAIADCSKAIELAPTDYEAYHNRGFSYYGKNDYDMAIADWSKAIELKPDDPWPYKDRGLAYNAKGDYDKAWADVKQCQSLGGTVAPDDLDKLRKASGQGMASQKAHGNSEAAPSGYIPLLNARVTNLRFCEGGYDAPPQQAQRTYSHSFAKAKTRSIYYELNLSYPVLKRRVNFDIDTTWYGPDGGIFGKTTNHCWAEAGWTDSNCCFGRGWNESGHFTTGNYRVDLFVQGGKVASGSFDISSEDAARNVQLENVNARYRASARREQNLANLRARIVKVEGDRIYINAGASFGVKPGDRFTCIHPTAVMIDRYTGQSLVRKEIKYGLVEVFEVSEKFSIAKAVGGIGFGAKDTILTERGAMNTSASLPR